MADERKRACVTGGNGFLASLLIKELLAKGYDVNATVRDPENLGKVAHLTELRGPGKLELFRAELGQEGSFDAAVTGCDYVFHVANPMNHFADDPENELIKPAIHGMLNLMKSCLKAKTVKRIVVTSTVGTVVPTNMTESVVNEDCWSDTELLVKEKPPTWGYMVAKTLAEKEAWEFARQNQMDLVTVIPGIIVGNALTLDAPPSTRAVLSLFSDDEFIMVKTLEEVLGSITIVHVEDVCRAHIFVAESEFTTGRYICCSISISLRKLAKFLSERYPQYKVSNNFSDLPVEGRLSYSSQKLIEAGFKFKYNDLGKIYDEIIEYGKVAGVLPVNVEQKN